MTTTNTRTPAPIGATINAQTPHPARMNKTRQINHARVIRHDRSMDGGAMMLLEYQKENVKNGMKRTQILVAWIHADRDQWQEIRA